SAARRRRRSRIPIPAGRHASGRFPFPSCPDAAMAAASPTSPSRPQPAALAVALALGAVYLVWGSTYLGIRFALEGGWPPLLMAGVRFLAAGGLLYAILRARGVAAPTPAQWRDLSLMGLLLLGLGNGMVCIAQQTVSSGLAA